MEKLNLAGVLGTPYLIATKSFGDGRKNFACSRADERVLRTNGNSNVKSLGNHPHSGFPKTPNGVPLSARRQG